MSCCVYQVGTVTALNSMVSAHVPEVTGHYFHRVIILLDRALDIFAVTQCGVSYLHFSRYDQNRSSWRVLDIFMNTFPLSGKPVIETLLLLFHWGCRT
jgi:hypothetical protein